MFLRAPVLGPSLILAGFVLRPPLGIWHTMDVVRLDSQKPLEQGLFLKWSATLSEGGLQMQAAAMDVGR